MQVTFLPMNRIIQGNKGDDLLQLARSLSIDLNSVCSGNGTCGKCKVIITKGNYSVTEQEKIQLNEGEIESGVRLACYFTIKEDTCVVVETVTREPLEEPLNKKSWDYNHKEAGVAFDIGTTSVEGRLYDLVDNQVLATSYKSNPQGAYGADIISRIQFSKMKNDNFQKLHELIVGCCEEMMEEMANRYDLPLQYVKKISAVGNTAMSRFFANDFSEKNPPKFTKIPWAQIIIPENIGGHVGSDTLGCILATEVYNKNGIFLIVDVGTNGEIVLSQNGKLTACSTAAGPAFEGASISQGMKAHKGAISQVKIQGGRIHISVIGGGNPIGICGSGLIDTVAELLKGGLMDETGRLLEEVTLSKSSNGSKITITQKDIRELQLAKAAIYTGITMLLKKEKVPLSKVDCLYLAGSFGNHMNVANAMAIGLLPALEEEKISLIGNGALDGAAKLLTGKIHLDTANEIGRKTRHMELASEPGFAEEYIQAIDFR